jgi:hypothetical protein
MAYCQRCNHEITDGQVICRPCTLLYGNSSKPVGVIILAIYLFYKAFSEFMSMIFIHASGSYLLFIKVPVILGIIVYLIEISITIYCGYGILKLKKKTREFSMYWIYYSLIEGLSKILIVKEIFNSTPLSRNLPLNAFTSLTTFIIYFDVIIILATNGFILYYLNRNKAYFIN